LFVECAWDANATLTGRELRERYRELKANTSPWYRPVRAGTVSSRSRLLHLSPRNAKRFLAPGLFRDLGPGVGWTWVKDPYRILSIYRPVGKKLWLPAEVPRQKSCPTKDEGIPLEGAMPVEFGSATFLLPDRTLSRVRFVGGLFGEPPPSYERTVYSQCRPPVSLTGGGYPDYECELFGASTRRSLCLGVGRHCIESSVEIVMGEPD